jgi:glycosyltransferase involved in cell wall biosynthesis
MKILLCAEFFYPSVGGAQEVVKQLAVRLLQRGHEITVVTSILKERQSDDYLGIKIRSFAISGNLANGLTGDMEQYRKFIKDGHFDLIFIYAAQQWTFDAIWNELPELTARKVFVPCGYSGLGNPGYQEYFQRLPRILKCFDAVIYHAYEYRDYQYAIQHQLQNSIFIPNGADEKEFSCAPNRRFRAENNIAANALVLLTVGALNGAKGHLEVAKAFGATHFKGSATLILNGNSMPSPDERLTSLVAKAKCLVNTRGIPGAARFVLDRVARRLGFKLDYVARLKRLTLAINDGRTGSNKNVLIVDLARSDLLTAFFEADLFVFASLIEYSPLVLYEACAAGLPFLTVPVGNAREIVEWTKGGEICPAQVDHDGFTRVEPAQLAAHIERLVNDPQRLMELGASGRAAWENRFNWNALATEYEELFLKLTSAPNQKSNP